MLIRRESLVHEGKGKAYDKREKGKAGDPKGKRERPKTENLIRDPTRHPDRAHARTTRNDFPVRGGLPKGELTPPNLRYMIPARGPQTLFFFKTGKQSGLTSGNP